MSRWPTRRSHIGPPPAVGVLPRHRQDRRRLPEDRRRGGPSRLRLPVRAGGLRRGARRRRHRLHRAECPRRSRRWATRSNRRSSPRRPASRPCPAISAPSATPPRRSRSPQAIGFPVMIKASAGGGGKGMRIARSAARSPRAGSAPAPRRKSSFGDDRVFIENYIEQSAPHRDPGARRQAWQRHLSRRARMLDPAAEPEDRRGGAVAGASTRRPREDGRARPSRWPRRSATIPPAPSSSSWAPTGASISSR